MEKEPSVNQFKVKIFPPCQAPSMTGPQLLLKAIIMPMLLSRIEMFYGEAARSRVS